MISIKLQAFKYNSRNDNVLKNKSYGMVDLDKLKEV